MDISGFLEVFPSQDSDTARTSGLTECAKAVNKTNLGRRLLMVTCMKPRLWRLQKRLGNGSGASHSRAWVNLYITRRTEFLGTVE
jgi:hypothetical protein